MENHRTFEITDLAGENLENVRWHGFMTVYAIVSITGGQKVTTEVDYERETNPKWDTPINFTLHDPSIHNNSLDLYILFFCDRTFQSDKYIAGYIIPVKRLFDEISGNFQSPRAVRYPVVNSANQEKGFVKFSFKFGELPKPTQKQHPSPPQPKPASQPPPQHRPPSQSSEQPPSSQQPQPSQRPKRQSQSPEKPPPQQELPSQSPQTPSSQRPRPPQRPKRKPQSPEQPPPQEPRPSSQSTQQPRPRPQQPRPQLQQQGTPPQPMPPSGQQQLRPQQPRPQQQQYPPQSRPPPRPQQRPYPQQTRPPPPRPRPQPQSTQNVAAVRAQFVATGQVQVPLSENSPNPHENPTEPALDNHIDQLNINVEAQYGIDPDHDNNIPGDNQFEYPENETYGQMSAPEYENNEINHDRDEYQDNEEGYGNNDEGYGYDGADNGEDYGDGEEGIEEGYQDDGVNNGEDYGDGEENYDDEEDYGGEEEEDYEDDEG